MLNIQFGNFPIINTERLVLRQPHLRDAGRIFALRTDKSVMKYVGRPMPANLGEVEALLEQMRQNFEENQGISWMICPTGDDSTIGVIGLWRIDKPNHRAEIGYMLHPDWQGRKLMQEAIRAVLHYGFHTLRLHSVEANVDPLNEASLRLLEKCGFTREAWFRENFYFKGKFLDSVIYGILTPIGGQQSALGGAPE